MPSFRDIERALRMAKLAKDAGLFDRKPPAPPKPQPRRGSRAEADRIREQALADRQRRQEVAVKKPEVARRGVGPADERRASPQELARLAKLTGGPGTSAGQTQRGDTRSSGRPGDDPVSGVRASSDRAERDRAERASVEGGVPARQSGPRRSGQVRPRFMTQEAYEREQRGKRGRGASERGESERPPSRKQSREAETVRADLAAQRRREHRREPAQKMGRAAAKGAKAAWEKARGLKPQADKDDARPYQERLQEETLRGRSARGGTGNDLPPGYEHPDTDRYMAAYRKAAERRAAERETAAREGVGNERDQREQPAGGRAQEPQLGRSREGGRRQTNDTGPTPKSRRSLQDYVDEQWRHDAKAGGWTDEEIAEVEKRNLRRDVIKDRDESLGPESAREKSEEPTMFERTTGSDDKAPERASRSRLARQIARERDALVRERQTGEPEPKEPEPEKPEPEKTTVSREGTETKDRDISFDR